MGNQTKVEENSPLMRAWKKYKKTEEYINTRQWIIQLEHTEGATWSVFANGFFAGRENASA